ncbi:hypothetical protein B0H11DRAFT_1009321 [Mycena galericulata]|nr:hypothetical protein B0H11DRAFT_1009321 [Mycena galericulata]
MQNRWMARGQSHRPSPRSTNFTRASSSACRSLLLRASTQTLVNLLTPVLQDRRPTHRRTRRHRPRTRTPPDRRVLPWIRLRATRVPICIFADTAPSPDRPVVPGLQTPCRAPRRRRAPAYTHALPGVPLRLQIDLGIPLPPRLPAGGTHRRRLLRARLPRAVRASLPSLPCAPVRPCEDA